MGSLISCSVCYSFFVVPIFVLGNETYKLDLGFSYRVTNVFHKFSAKAEVGKVKSYVGLPVRAIVGLLVLPPTPLPPGGGGGGVRDSRHFFCELFTITIAFKEI